MTLKRADGLHTILGLWELLYGCKFMVHSVRKVAGTSVVCCPNLLQCCPIEGSDALCKCFKIV